MSQVDPTVNGLNEPGVRRNRLIRGAKAAAGKALLVYLGTGSIGAAIVAYIVFRMMGC
jgi:hypothetical protein